MASHCPRAERRVPLAPMAFGCVVFVVVATFLLLARPARAVLDPPYITPASPTAGEMISVNIYGGQCDLVHDGVFPPIVTREDAGITILFTGIHEGDPEWCYFGVGTVTYAVGAYASGEYSLEVRRRYFNFAGALVEETLAVIPFSVTADSPSSRAVAAPTSSNGALSVLLVALVLVARRHSREHGPGTCS